MLVIFNANQTSMCLDLYTSELRGEFGTVKHVKTLQYILLTVLRWCFFCGSFLLFMYHVCLCYAALSIQCSLVITCWERADLFAVLCVVFSCVFVTFPYGVPDQVWYLIVSLPDLCHPLYFTTRHADCCMMSMLYPAFLYNV